jgi:hypothetical protein
VATILRIKPQNLLRWDMKVEKGATGEKRRRSITSSSWNILAMFRLRISR